MPLFKISTNVKSVPDDLIEKMVDLLSEMLKKEKQYILAVVECDKTMQMGDKAPCAMVEIMNMGHLGPEENKEHSKKIAAFLDTHLGINGHHHFVVFTDLDPHNVGYAGTTLGEILKNV